MALAYALARNAVALSVTDGLNFEGIFTGSGGALTVVLVGGDTMVLTGVEPNLFLPIHVIEVVSTDITGGYGLYMETRGSGM